MPRLERSAERVESRRDRERHRDQVRCSRRHSRSDRQDDVVRRTATGTGCEVLNGLAALRGSARLPADVIHLGDVIEHLQGPLEAGPCLFTAVLRAASALRPGRVTRMPSYHVLQASVEGQRVLFDRVGLAPAKKLRFF